MKNIVICFDGTWNTADAEYPTNVVKTAKMLLPTDANHANQVVFYDEGVGSGRVAFGQTINGLLGGAFGAGLMNNIQSGLSVSRLQLLARRQDFPVRIFPRCLQRALIRGPAANLRGLEQGVHKQGRGGRCHLQEPGPQAWCRCARVHQVPPRLQCRLLQKLRQCRAGHPPSAHGRVHGRLGNRWLARRSVRLPVRKPVQPEVSISRSRAVAHGKKRAACAGHRREEAHVRRHAVGEHRRPQSSCRSSGCSCRRAALSAAVVSGDHATVGGGGDVNGLWEASLVWVVEGGQRCGLAVDQASLDAYRNNIKHFVSVHCMNRRTFSWSSLSLRRWREGRRRAGGGGLGGRASAHQGEQGRLFERRLYRPKSLREVLQGLAQQLGLSG